MDKFEFMNIISDTFAELKSDVEIDFRAEEMIKLILQYKQQAKAYLKAGML